MRVSAKTDYALRALLEMASRSDSKPVSAEELGRLQDIPHGFLQAILADLRKAAVGGDDDMLLGGGLPPGF